MLSMVSQTAAARGLSGIETRSGGAETLPFAEGTFDLAASRFSAHHWRHLEAGVREMCKVIRPGGCLLMIDSLGHEDPLVDTYLQAIELLRDPSHVRNRSLSQWRSLLGAAGVRDLQWTQWSLRLDFESWVERMRTPPARVEVIRELQRGAAREVHAALGLEADGSFSIQVGSLWGRLGSPGREA